MRNVSPHNLSSQTYVGQARFKADGVQNKADPEKGLARGGSIINVASFVAILGAATPQLACE